MTGVKLSSSLYLIYWSFVHPLGGEVMWAKGVDGWGRGVGIVVLASSEYYFISVHENLVQHPKNNISFGLTACHKLHNYLI